MESQLTEHARFEQAKTRGLRGEDVFAQYCTQLDFDKPLPIQYSPVNENGVILINRTLPQGFKRIGRGNENNENRDFERTTAKGIERHEVKTDYRCLGEACKNTGNIIVEVDIKSIANLDEVRRSGQTRGIKSKKGWLHTSNDIQAHYYTFVLMLAESELSKSHGVVTKQEINAFMNDASIPSNALMMRRYPPEIAIVMSNASLKHFLTKYAGVEWVNNAERSKTHILVVLPIERISRDINKGERKGECTIMTIYRDMIRKGEDNTEEGLVHVTRRMVETFEVELSEEQTERCLMNSGLFGRTYTIPITGSGVKGFLSFTFDSSVEATIKSEHAINLFEGESGKYFEPLIFQNEVKKLHIVDYSSSF